MAADSVRFVRATAQDAATLGRLHALGWRAAYRGIATDAFLEAFSPERRAAYFARILPVTANENYVVWAGDTPAGMLAIGAADDEALTGQHCGEVIALYLLPECWGQGIGLSAMRFAVDRLGALGYGDTVLTVLSENARALCFYTRFGFAPDGPEEPFDMGRPVLERRYRLRRE